MGDLIKAEINDIDACVEFNRKTSTLKLVLTVAQQRDEAIAILEKHLGEICAAVDEEKAPPKTLVFPLNDHQLKQLTNEQHLRMLIDELPANCTVGVDKGLLELKIPADSPKIKPIHKLEKRLGILLSVEEIAQIRKDIRLDGADADSIDELQLNDKDFFNNMVSVLRNGVPFIKHRKREVYDTRYILIRTDRLYWKERQEDRHEKKRSFHLTKIVNASIGKCSKPLLHEALANIPENCCFSVVTKKATLDLSTPTMDPIEVRKFVAYLKGFQRHLILQHSQTGRDTHRHHKARGDHSGHGHGTGKHASSKPRMSPIGQGFPGFNFDPKSVQEQMSEIQLAQEQQAKERAIANASASSDAKNGNESNEDLYSQSVMYQ